MDATYRGDLRELNELNFARFDAKLEQRAAQLDAKIEQRVGQLDAKLEQRVTEVRAETRTGLAHLKAELVRWMFLFWFGTVGTLVALLKL